MNPCQLPKALTLTQTDDPKHSAPNGSGPVGRRCNPTRVYLPRSSPESFYALCMYSPRKVSYSGQEFLTPLTDKPLLRDAPPRIRDYLGRGVLRVARPEDLRSSYMKPYAPQAPIQKRIWRTPPPPNEKQEIIIWGDIVPYAYFSSFQLANLCSLKIQDIKLYTSKRGWGIVVHVLRHYCLL